MNAGELSSSAAKLHNAWKKLRADWELTKLQWHDPVSRHFEDDYLATLEPQIDATLDRMRALAGVLGAAKQECDH